MIRGFHAKNISLSLSWIIFFSKQAFLRLVSMKWLISTFLQDYLYGLSLGSKRISNLSEISTRKCSFTESCQSQRYGESNIGVPFWYATRWGKPNLIGTSHTDLDTRFLSIFSNDNEDGKHPHRFWVTVYPDKNSTGGDCFAWLKYNPEMFTVWVNYKRVL